MNPFMLQHSNVIHDERLEEAKKHRLFNTYGTNQTEPKSTVMQKVENFFVSISKKLNVQPKLDPATSTSRLS